MVIGDQDRWARLGVDDDRPSRQIIQTTGGQDSIIGSHKATTASIPFSCDLPVEFWCEEGAA
jgi:hypothetical protein